MITNRLNNLYRYKRVYQGPIKAVILDWSGTTVDKYVIAPAVVFVNIFEKFGVPITWGEAREPMGHEKCAHIREITRNPEVAERWLKVHGRYPNETDVLSMFAEFLPEQLDCLPQYCDLLPDVAKTVNTLRHDFNTLIGSTTGFNGQMVDVLLENAYEQGYRPDVSVAADGKVVSFMDSHKPRIYKVPIARARPASYMVETNKMVMDVTDNKSIVKIDDTVAGIEEGLNAGCWTIGVARYSNYMDINSEEEERKLSEDDINKKLEQSRKKLAMADFVVNDLRDVPYVLDKINNYQMNGGY